MFLVFPNSLPFVWVGRFSNKAYFKICFVTKMLTWTNGKELGNTQNRKVVDNFKTFPMGQSIPNYEL